MRLLALLLHDMGDGMGRHLRHRQEGVETKKQQLETAEEEEEVEEGEKSWTC